MKKIKAKGTLANMLANVDEQQLYRTETKMRIAAKISLALRKNGISNKDFAEMMGWSAPEVSDILSGTRNLTLDKLSDIEYKLKVKLVSHSMAVTSTVDRNMLSMQKKKNSSSKYFIWKTETYIVPHFMNSATNLKTIKAC